MGIKDIVGALVKMPNMPAPSLAKAKRANLDSLEQMWNKDTKRRKPREQMWQLNLAMVMGNQWVGWNGANVQTLQAPSWRVQNVDNKLFVRVRSKMSRLLQDMTPTAIPESAEFIDIRRAEYKERLLRHAHREIGIKRVRFRGAQWLVTCGEVYTEAYWDKSAGDTYADDGGSISEGDVAVRLWDPFAVWPGAGCSASNNGGRLTTVDLLPVELARLKFNDAKIEPDSTNSSDIKMRSSVENFFSQGGARDYAVGNDANVEEMVQVRTVRMYRTKENPLGKIVVVVNKRIIEEKDLLWDGITHIINYPNYSGYHGDPVEVRNSIQQQKSYNRLRSNWEEYVRTLAKGKILAHESLDIKSSQFTSEHLEIVRYKGSGPPPSPWMPPPMPNDTANLMQVCVAAIDDAFSDHMASQGKAPASASGAAINYLTESDAMQHTATEDEWRAGWERTDEKILDVIAGKAGPGTGYKAGRSVTIIGENRRADVMKVEEDMIAGKNRVYIVPGGALPENKTLRAEVARRWLEAGVFGPPGTPEANRKFLKMVGGGVKEDVYNDEALDEIRAEWENEQLKLGTRVAPRPEDGHSTHAFVHQHFMKTDEFLHLPEEIQDGFYDHMDLTMMMATSPAGVPQQGGAMPQPDNPEAVGNPVDMLKSVQQGGEPPPAVGAPGPEMPLE